MNRILIGFILPLYGFDEEKKDLTTCQLDLSSLLKTIFALL